MPAVCRGLQALPFYVVYLLEAISKTSHIILPDGSTTHRVVDDALTPFAYPP